MLKTYIKALSMACHELGIMTGDCPYSKYKQCVNVSDCRDSGQCWINFYLDKACSALNKN